MTKKTVDFAAAGKAAGERFRDLWPHSHVSTNALEFAWRDLEARTPVSVSMTGAHQWVFFEAFRAAAGEPKAPLSCTAPATSAITDEQLLLLQQEGEMAGDDAQVALCKKALGGSAAARAKCATVLADAAAQDY